ncbi:MAG: serine hydrolase domain-containing protein [Bacteroidota bacterium]
MKKICGLPEAVSALKKQFLIVLALGIASVSCSQSPKEKVDLTHQLKQLTNEYLALNEEASGAMLRVHQPGKLDLGYSVGFKGIQKKERLSGKEPFIAASITKTFIAVCLLKLVEEGRLHLEDKVIKYIDGSIIEKLTKYEGKSYEHQLTIEHLLRHRSGIHDYLNKGQVHLDGYKERPHKNYSLEDRLDIALSNGTAVNKINTYFYSNTNYILLGMIIEKIEKRAIDEVVKTRICDPLGLDNTTLNPSSTVVQTMWRGYYTDWDLTSFTLEFNKGNPAGGILTTADDLIKFGQGLFNGILFQDRDSLKLMLDFQKGYGLGLMLFDKSRKTGKIVGHSGFDPGYTCYLIHLETPNITLVTAINQSELKVKMPAFLPVKAVAAIKKAM